VQDEALLGAVIETVTAIADDQITPRFLNTARERKSDGSIVTQADRAASDALIAALPRLARHPVLSEEMPRPAQQAQWDAGGDGLWCIDPLDGTSNFANGLGQFAVSVALLRGGRPVLGVVHAPALRETFSARAGAGAWFNGQALPQRPAAARLRDAVAGVDFKRLAPSLAGRLALAPPYHSQRNHGSSALELAYTAAGRFDVYVHGSQKMWDYAAGALILVEAGGAICALDSDDFWAQEPWQRSVVAAASPALLAAWRDWLRSPPPS